MHYETEKLDKLSYRLHVTLPADEVRARADKRLSELSRKTKMDGFRPGNVDMRLMRQRYGDGVLKEVLEESLREAYARAVKDGDIRPVTTPQFRRKESGKEGGEGDKYEFFAEVEVEPEFELADLSRMQVEQRRAEVGEEDIDKLVDDLRRQAATYRPVVRAATDGDRVVVQFENAADATMLGADESGVAQFAVSTAEGAWTAPLAGAIPGDRCSLMKPGADGKPREKSRIILPGQTEAPDADEIPVVVKDVQEGVLPEVDKEFLKQFEVADADELRSKLRAGAERELQWRIRALFKDALIDAVVAGHEVPIPQSMVKEQIASMRRDVVERMGVDAARVQDDELFRAQAERTVKLSLILNKIIDEHPDEVKVDGREIDAHLQAMAEQYEDGERVVGQYRKDAKVRAQIGRTILEGKVFAWMGEKVRVLEKDCSFGEVMAARGEGR